MLQTHLRMGKKVSLTEAPKIRTLIVEKHPAVRRALSDRLGATVNLDIIGSVDSPDAAMPLLESQDHQTGRKGSSIVVLYGLQNNGAGLDEQLVKTLDFVSQMVDRAAAVIVLAPFADEVERLLLQQAGIKSYLLKYIDSARLISEIESVAEQGYRSISPAP